MKQRKFIRLIAALLCMMLVFGTLPIAAAGSLVNLDIRKNQSTASIDYAEGIQNINVHTAKADGYHFLLGASIVKFGDIWVCSFGQSLETENDANTRFVCKYSYNNGLTWSEEEVVIATTEGDLSRGHGVLYNDGETLWAFCPKAPFSGTDKFANLDFCMEAYTLDTSTMTWTAKGVVMEEDFWPLCEPIQLSNGDVLIAGLECNGNAQAAVAIAKDGDLTSFEMVVIPNENNISVWGETTVIDYGDRLVAFVRTTASVGKIAVSESTDGGRSWSSLVLSDMEATASKLYGGTLSTGSRYLIYNTGGTREKLVIAIGKPDGSYGFENIYLIKNGFEKNSQFGFAKQWAYPYAVEEDGKLYVVYSENKEDCELSIIPVSSLAYRETADVDVYETIDHTKPSNIPAYQTIAELVDMDEQVWWSSEGDGYGGVVYTTIEGVPVVAKQQSSITNQVLRRNFDVDISEEDYDRLAFEITFWYAADGIAEGASTQNRFFWGNSTSKSGLNKPLSSDYTIHDGRRIEYNASTGELWSSVKQGWNTFFISFGALAFAQNLEELNTFFSVLKRNTAIKDGEILYGISSLKLVRIAEPEEKELELRVENGVIQWRYGNDAEWIDLISISDLSGVPGTPGADGADGKDGATWTVGEGVPTADANEGDLYLDLTTGDVYRYATVWSKVGNIKGADGTDGAPGANGSDGAPGADGNDGADGADGKDGATWTVGEGVPTADANEGDLYLDLTTGDVYRYATVWSKVGNIKGADGTDGAPGANGSDGAPGADGNDGADGAPGADGADGKDGATWTVGEGVPTADANEGDLYLDLATGDVYRYATVWNKVGNIKGVQGDVGPQGPQGEVGPQGETGAQGEKGEDGADASLSGSVNNAGGVSSDDAVTDAADNGGVQMAAIVIAVISLAGNGALLLFVLIQKKKKV